MSGSWNTDGSLIVHAGNFTIAERNSVSISSAGGEGSNSGGEGFNSGGEGSNSGGESGNSGDNEHGAIEMPNINLKEGHTNLFKRDFDHEASPIQFKNPFIERIYKPLVICGFSEYPCTQRPE